MRWDLRLPWTINCSPAQNRFKFVFEEKRLRKIFGSWNINCIQCSVHEIMFKPHFSVLSTYAQEISSLSLKHHFQLSAMIKFKHFGILCECLRFPFWNILIEKSVQLVEERTPLRSCAWRNVSESYDWKRFLFDNHWRIN